MKLFDFMKIDFSSNHEIVKSINWLVGLNVDSICGWGLGLRNKSEKNGGLGVGFLFFGLYTKAIM